MTSAKARMSGLEAVTALIAAIGENPLREGLKDTPRRVMKAWEAWTAGYNADPKAILKTFKDGADGVDQMVVQGGIPFYSMCEHHMAPFFGYANIAYVPLGKIVGLSKLARLLDAFARRLQVQERLCNQIADALIEHLEPLGAGVVIHARHLCMESRGVQKIGTVTITSALRGCIKDEATSRAEFMSFVHAAMNGIKVL